MMVFGNEGQADWVYEINEAGKVIAIVDINIGSKSVTNDASHIISVLTRNGIDVDDYVIAYRDSTERWDRIVTKGGAFARFAPLPDSVPSPATELPAKTGQREAVEVIENVWIK